MTAPVGLPGLLTSTAFVRVVTALATSRAVTRNPSFSLVWATTGRPPARRTASEKVGQCGVGITTSSPRSRSALQTRCSACFPPMVTATSAGSNVTLKSWR